MSERVASLACARSHPELGWVCQRRRHHTGDHMGTDDQDRRYTWGDVIGLDETTETVSTPGTFEHLALEDLPPPPGYAPLSAWWLSLLVLFWLLVPAVVILAYRIALR